jgi:hypothetical protein
VLPLVQHEICEARGVSAHSALPVVQDRGASRDPRCCRNQDAVVKQNGRQRRVLGESLRGSPNASRNAVKVASDRSGRFLSIAANGELEAEVGAPEPFNEQLRRSRLEVGVGVFRRDDLDERVLACRLDREVGLFPSAPSGSNSTIVRPRRSNA